MNLNWELKDKYEGSSQGEPWLAASQGVGGQGDAHLLLWYSRHLAKRIQVGSSSCCMITKMPVLREEGE